MALSPDVLPGGFYVAPQARAPHDPNVSFEEYFYYAQGTREEENNIEPPKLNWRQFLHPKKKVVRWKGKEIPFSTV